MRYKFEIKGRLPGVNELISANRTNPYKGAKLKAETEDLVIYAIKSQLRDVRILKPVTIHYHYFERNAKRDLDNISGMAHKVIQDALVKTKVLLNDGWREIKGYTDDFFIDKDNPRIDVEIVEVENG